MSTVLYVLIGTLALVAGVVFAFSPIVPGFVFVLVGLGLIGARSIWLAHRLDRFEVLCRRWIPRRWAGDRAARSAARGRD